MNTLHRIIKEEIFVKTETFHSKVMAVIRNLRWNLLIIGNHYAKYGHPPSKKNQEFTLQAFSQVLSIVDLDSKVILTI